MDGFETPPYSPDMNPCDYDLFFRIKGPHKGIKFTNEYQLRHAYENTINELNRNEEVIGISRLPQRWQEVIHNDGDYII